MCLVRGGFLLQADRSQFGCQLCSSSSSSSSTGPQDLQLRGEADAVAAGRQGVVSLAARGQGGARRAGRGNRCAGIVAAMVLMGVNRGREVQSGRRGAQEVIWCLVERCGLERG